MRVFAIRGAITLTRDTKSEVINNSVDLINEIILKNNIKEKEVVSIMISTTQDIHSYYPAKAIRESAVLKAPLFSCAEPDIDGALKLCVRIMITAMKKNRFVPKHVYLKNARSLRTDLQYE